MFHKKPFLLFPFFLIAFQILTFDFCSSSKVKNSAKETSHDVLASDALLLLKEGNRTFAIKTFPKRPSVDQGLASSASPQKPHSIILSCSDSRVPPSLIFNQGLGEIFSVRDAGEVPGIAVIGSIEYAIQALGAPLLIVMGHTDCGAIKAGLSAFKDHPAESPSLQAVITEIRNNIGDKPLETASPHFKDEAFLNAKEVARNLIKRSDIIKKHVTEGTLMVVPALYDLQTGYVEFGALIAEPEW